MRPIINTLSIPFEYVHKLLNGITMYRVVLYGLSALVVYGLLMSLLGFTYFSFAASLISLVVIVASALIVHFVLQTLTKAPANIESTYITALILYLIISPSNKLHDVLLIALTSAIAIGCKYLLKYGNRHIFNPAAIAVFITGTLLQFGADWWVGARYMLPAVLVAGFAVVMKIRRYELVGYYLAVSTALALVLNHEYATVLQTLRTQFFSWPTLFFAAFMLTEPLALPSTKKGQITYACLAAVVGTIPFSFGWLNSTPEFALVVANLFSFIIDRGRRYTLKFEKRELVAANTYEYYFSSPSVIKHKAGQYMEWSVPHGGVDTRGIKRYLTISSKPNEHMVAFTIKHVPQQSSWKAKVEQLVSGEVIYAVGVSGDFTIKKPQKHHVFIAGGIGITPFVSMIRDALSSDKPLNATLFYANMNVTDIAFTALLDQAKDQGLVVVNYLVNDPTEPVSFTYEKGFIDTDHLKKYVPLFADADYYISGPPAMVSNYTKMIVGLGISHRDIHTDYFPGLA